MPEREMLCPKCSSAVTCGVSSDEGADGAWQDTYTHTCSNEQCDFQETDMRQGSGWSNLSGSKPGPCPMCGKFY